MRGRLSVKTQTGSSDIGPLEYVETMENIFWPWISWCGRSLFWDIVALFLPAKGKCLELLIAFLSSLSFNFVEGVSVGGDLW